MKGKHMRITILSTLLLILIIDPTTGIQAAIEGIEQCLRSIIPAVFPFIYLSGTLANELKGIKIKPFEHLLKIPEGYGIFFLLGQLCGYPVGAMTLGNEITSGRIPHEAGERMICFCNNASPAFIIGVLSSYFSVPEAIAMWIIQMISALFLGIIMPHEQIVKLPRGNGRGSTPPPVMKNTILGIANICGWVVIFKILIGYIQAQFAFNGIHGVLLAGILELTNGLILLPQIHNKVIGYTLSAFLLSFGGFCVLLQTRSVAPMVRIRTYLFARFIHSLISSTLSCIVASVRYRHYCLLRFFIPLSVCAIIICGLIMIFNKKSGSIRRKAIV